MTRPAPLAVLFAIPELDRGGPDRVMFELLSRLDRSAFAPALLVSNPEGHYLAQLPRDIPVHVLGGRARLTRRYPVMSSLRAIWRRPPRVVFATQRMILTLGAASLAFPRTTRLIVRQANDVSADFDALVQQTIIKHRLARALALATLGRADAVVCQSDAMRDDLRALLGARARLHVIWNPIDGARARARAGATTAILPGAPALVTVGRLAPQKGHDVLLAALPRVRALYPGLHLTILGDGPERARLEAQRASLGLTDAVTFAGFAAEPLPAVRAADLFVLASRYEGFPNAALEALACGTPVVLTDCPGANRDIVLPGTNGRLAGGATPEAVAAALLEALAERPTYAREAIQGDCEARFSAARIVTAYERVISSVAEADHA